MTDVSRGTRHVVARLALILAVFVAPGSAPAQHVTVDGLLSPAQTLSGPNYAITAGLGKQLGANLFHSFGVFGLTQGETATFSGPTTVANIISRVTGGTASSIDGTIASTISKANLYLINPSGIVFGPNATVNVSGSFHASTADYLKMSDGAKFQATNPSGSTFSAAAPAAFGFINTAPPAITVNGSTLGVNPGQTLGLVGGPVTIKNSALLTAPAGTIHVTSAAGTGEVPVDPTNVSASTVTSFGSVSIAGSLTTLDVSDFSNKGSGGSIYIRSGTLTIDSAFLDGTNYGTSPGGQISLFGASQIALSNGAAIHSPGTAAGRGGDITLKTGSGGSISASGGTLVDVGSGPVGGSIASGGSGTLTVTTGTLTLTGGAIFGSDVHGSGSTGPISITADSIMLDGRASTSSAALTGIRSDTTAGSANAADITINSGALSILANGQIVTNTFGAGNAGRVSVTLTGALSIDATSAVYSTGIGTVASPNSTGNAGDLTISAASLSIVGNTGSLIPPISGSKPFSGLSAQTFSSGQGGSITLNLGSGALAMSNGGVVSSTTGGSGRGGALDIVTQGTLTLTGSGTAITAAALTGASGDAGSVTVSAPQASVESGAQITSTTAGTGAGGSVAVTISGALLLDGMGISGTAITAEALAGSSGNAGTVVVSAGSLTVQGGAQIASSTAGSGNGGDIAVTSNGALLLTGIESAITASASASGNAGSVAVAAPQASVESGAQISSTTAGTGAGGSVAVTISGALLLDGMGVTPTQIAASATGAQSGNGGAVTVSAGSLTVQGGAQIASSTAGPGNGGDIVVTSTGALMLTGTGTAITAAALAGASGNAGSVTVVAPQASVESGAQIASTTAGTGAGGSVAVTISGALLLDGMGVTPTQIAASATGAQSGNGGAVTVSAGSLTVQGGAQIASSTAGPGNGGDVVVTAAGNIALSGPGPQITARSTGSGDAGSILVSGLNLKMSGGAAISTEAATANGGDIALAVGNFLYLVDSEITTSVEGATGNGGNIAIDPKLLVLDHSEIIAQAVLGHGGNITIVADEYFPSADSLVSATSSLGISGIVEVIGPRTALDGSLVVLPSELRAAAAVSRDSCAARGNRPRSSLTKAGRGGLPQDPEAPLLAVYLADRDVTLGSSAASTERHGERSLASLTTVRMKINCQ